MTEAIFRQEPEHPRHVVPLCWQVFNKEYDMDRGLFFLDGEKWQNMRKKMNPMLLKKPGVHSSHENSQRITNNLIRDLIVQVDKNPEQ